MFFKKKSKQIEVAGNSITVRKINDQDFISITDMLKSKDGDFFVSDWLRNRNTIEFLGAWESLNNPNFNYGEFDIIKSKAGLNSYKISVKEWVKKTNAIGLLAEAGRYGGTFAHVDIAFEFGMWVSPHFKLYLIKEYQRLKAIENNQYNVEWDIKRVITKANYSVHTDAVKEYIIPQSRKWNKAYEYASEADLLNVAIFGLTAQEWRKKNPERAKSGENIRDSASINELIVLSNAESRNAQMIREGVSKEERFAKIQEMAKIEFESLHKYDAKKSLKKLTPETYLLEEKK